MYVGIINFDGPDKIPTANMPSSAVVRVSDIVGPARAVFRDGVEMPQNRNEMLLFVSSANAGSQDHLFVPQLMPSKMPVESYVLISGGLRVVKVHPPLLRVLVWGSVLGNARMHSHHAEG